MIPAFLVKRFGETVARLIVAGVILLLAIGLYFGVRSFFTAGLETQVRLGQGQGKADRASGHDAVQSLGNVMGNEQAGDQITQENGNAIDHAKGADAGVDPGVRAVGVRSLCRRASYRASHPQCVQHPPAR